MTQAEELSTVQTRAETAPEASKVHQDGKVISTDVHGDWAEGVTYDDEKFLVPKTADTLEVFLNPKHINIGTGIALIPIAINFILAFVIKAPIWVNIIWFLIFRAGYNVGLGYLLHVQSKYNQITHWYRQYAKKQPSSPLGQLFNRLVDGGLPDGSTQTDFPDAFNAWILYKAIVNASLVNDSTSYFFLAARCFTAPESITIVLLLQYFLAFLLVVFFIWAKYDSHRCIGTYCWYWGDFFYRKHVSLTFDGIFELFPHPMYTVGYSAYYATVLITQSYTMLFCSLVAHMSQLLFLVFVEEPHIKKIYGDSEGTVERDEAALYDGQKGWFPSRTELSYFASGLDPFSSTTWIVLFISFYATLVALLPESSTHAVAQVLFWRFVHWGVISYILWAQSTRQLFTKYFISQGRTLQEAFGHWKRIYNISSAVNFISFIAAAVRFFPQFTLENIFSMPFFAKLATLAALTFLSLWTTYSTYHSIGDFGWFYGDFFVPPSEYTHKLCYTGIYRFLNNPDVLTGYAGLYGLGVFCEGWTILILAALTHTCHFVFLHTVEIPHMERIYDTQNQQAVAEASAATTDSQGNVVRPKGPLRAKVTDLLTHKANVPLDQVQTRLLQVKRQTLGALFDVFSGLQRERQDDSKTKGITLSVKQKSFPLNTPITVSFTAPESHSDEDWVGLYPAAIKSAPGLSDGSWLYVPAGQSGSVTFKPIQLPRTEGVYEFRYHSKGSYSVIASAPIVLTNDEQVSTELDKAVAKKD